MLSLYNLATCLVAGLALFGGAAAAPAKDIGNPCTTFTQTVTMTITSPGGHASIILTEVETITMLPHIVPIPVHPTTSAGALRFQVTSSPSAVDPGVTETMTPTGPTSTNTPPVNSHPTVTPIFGPGMPPHHETQTPHGHDTAKHSHHRSGLNTWLTADDILPTRISASVSMPHSHHETQTPHGHHTAKHSGPNTWLTTEGGVVAARAQQTVIWSSCQDSPIVAEPTCVTSTTVLMAAPSTMKTKAVVSA